MKDVSGKIQYNNKEYTLVFNLNVMEALQEEYGSFEEWGRYSNGEYIAKAQYEKLGKKKSWDDLSDAEKAKFKTGEPEIKSVIFAIREAVNEGIDIENEEKGTNTPPMSLKQVGRLVTQIGFTNAVTLLHKLVKDSTKAEQKNV